MGLALVDGFDDYASSQTADGGVNSTWPDFSSNATKTMVTGLLGTGRAMSISGGNNTVGFARQFAQATNDTCIAAFRFKCSGFSRLNFFCLLLNGGLQINLGLNSAGNILLINGNFDTNSNTILATSSAAMVGGTTYFIEIKCKAHSSGTCSIWIDGTQVMAYTGNTARSGVNGVNQLGFGSGFIVDDLYVLNSDADARLGDMKVTTLLPNADTADADWTKSTGTDGYALIDDDQADTSDYITSAVAGDLSLFDFTALGFTPSIIAGVVVETLAKKSDAGTATMRNVVKSNTTVSNGATISLGTSFVNMPQTIVVNDPDTTAAWTLSAINAIQAGVERIA